MSIPDRTCQLCGASISEYSDSPWCNYCSRVMCPACERKHNKEECKIEQDFKKSQNKIK